MSDAPGVSSAFRTLPTRVAAVLRRILGAPDYDRYVAHLRRAHPGATPLSPTDFARDALARRYDKPGSRCC